MNYKNVYKLFSFKELIIIKIIQSNINFIKIETQTIEEKEIMREKLESHPYEGIMSIIHDKQKCMMQYYLKNFTDPLSRIFRSIF